MDKIKTTHVGSLPRSNELSELLFKKDKKEKIDLVKFDKIVKKDVEKIVKKQIELGIDIVSDGEMSKISYATYVKDRIDGFSGESERKAPKDLDDFPSFKERIARTGGTPTYTRPCCTNELKIKDRTSLAKDIENFKNAITANNHKEAFMNAASPGVISAFLPNKFYKNDDEYLENLSNVMKSEYEEIVSNGIYLQLDCPDLALARHMTFKDLSEQEFLKKAEKQVEYLNHAIKNIDSICTALKTEKRMVMLDHDDLFLSIIRNKENKESVQTYEKKLIDYCKKEKISLLRTVGVIFTDDEKQMESSA